MKPSVHATVSCAGAAALWALTHSWQAALWSFIAGVFIDLDHVYEYLKAKKRWHSVGDFLEFFKAYREPKVYVWFHSIELLAVLVIAGFADCAPGFTLGLAFGMLHHLAVDQFGNGTRRGAYFLTYRIFVGFQTERVFVLAPQPEIPS